MIAARPTTEPISRAARRVMVIAFLAAGLLGPRSTAAHEGLHEQIAEVTARIKREPKNAALFLKRGELHRLHRNWDRALSDYRRAEMLDPNLDAVQFGLGRMYFEAGKPQQAKSRLDRYLSRHPNQVEALVTRARLLVKLGLRHAAANDYSAAIAQSPEPKPEYYIERAKALAGEGPAGRQVALAGLDEGIKKLGPIVTLELFAIDLEVASRHYDAALERLERVAAQSQRKEAWLARRGEILRQAGRVAEAREAFSRALEALESLPAFRRNTKATVELENRVRAALQQ
jgi:tetratricopeptide (TPR) repeat protein